MRKSINRFYCWVFAFLMILSSNGLFAQAGAGSKWGVVNETDRAGRVTGYHVTYNNKKFGKKIEQSHFLWQVEDCHYYEGTSFEHEFQGAPGPDEVELWVSSRYSEDTDPPERYGFEGINNGLVGGLTASDFGLALSREPRADFSSYVLMSGGNANPVLVQVKIDGPASWNLTGRCAEYIELDSLLDGCDLVNEKKFSPGERWFLVSNDTTFSPIPRYHHVLPFCTADSATPEDTVTVTMVTYEIQPGQDLPGMVRSASLQQTNVSDATPIDTLVIKSAIVESWDPNDKLVSNRIAAPGDWIVYTIRFENIGGATENDVSILDIIPKWVQPDFSRLITSLNLQANAAYDPATRKVEFTFTDPTGGTFILLPEEKGFVAFRAQVDPSTPLGTVIRNRAMIRFGQAGQELITPPTFTLIPNPAGNRRAAAGGECCEELKGYCPSPIRSNIMLGLLVLITLLVLVIALRRAN